MGFKSAWEGFTNYLSSTKDEVVSEWEEFQDEIDKPLAMNSQLPQTYYNKLPMDSLLQLKL